MAEVIGIFGESGTGKSSSTATLNPKDTFIINVLDKRLPYKGSASLYNKANNNYLATDNYEVIIAALKQIAQAKHIKNVIIDDATYIMSNEFMARAQEKGYEKFTQLAVHFQRILNEAQKLPDHMKVFVLGHTNLDDDGNFKIKTVGKLLDSQWNVAGLFTTILITVVDMQGNEPVYLFATNKVGPYCAKSPKGMFELMIPNDLALVSQKIEEYYK
jgi:hypothetical protein